MRAGRPMASSSVKPELPVLRQTAALPYQGFANTAA